MIQISHFFIQQKLIQGSLYPRMMLEIYIIFISDHNWTTQANKVKLNFTIASGYTPLVALFMFF